MRNFLYKAFLLLLMVMLTTLARLGAIPTVVGFVLASYLAFPLVFGNYHKKEGSK